MESSDEDRSPGPSFHRELNLFSGLPSVDTFPDPRSDFDYALALQSEFIDTAFKELGRSSPVKSRTQCYAVDGEEDILASDPYPRSP